jgi:cytochrome c oxidase subunit 4
MSNASHSEEAGVHGVEAPHVHVLPLGLYFGILAILIVLTVLTVAVAQVPLGPFNLPVAMLVATIKASLVLAVFMHLYWDNKFNLLILVSSLLFLSLFIVLAMIDVGSRDMVDPQRRNFLPRDEVVHAAEEKAHGEANLRPGEPFGDPRGKEHYDEHVKEHGASGGHEGGEAKAEH